jgi:hypothetical protein
MRELLDEHLYLEAKPEVEAPIWSWIAPFVLWAGLIATLSEGLGGRSKVIAAICCLFTATIATLVNRRIGARLTMLVLVLAMFRVLVFLPASYYVSFGIEYYHLGIDVLFLGLGMIHYISNRNILAHFFAITPPTQPSESEKEIAKLARIAAFKSRFCRKSIDELYLKAENEELVPEAQLAARELIMEKELV